MLTADAHAMLELLSPSSLRTGDLDLWYYAGHLPVIWHLVVTVDVSAVRYPRSPPDDVNIKSGT